MAASSPLRIDGPPPAARPYGIVTTPGTIVDEGDPHWRGGVVVDSYPNDLPESHNPCATGTMAVKATGTSPPWPEFSAFTVVYPMTCSGIGLGNEAGAQRMRNRAVEVFKAVEGWDVERELAFGDSDPDRPHFTEPGRATFPAGAAGTAVSVMEGVSLLENAIGNTARQGMIHVDPATFIRGLDNYLWEDDRGVMRTGRGTPVIVGDGYIGATIGGVLSADQAFAWATGPVRVTRDDQPEVLGPTSQVLNREDNTATFRVERNYVAYWDTSLLAGVRVDRSSTP